MMPPTRPGRHRSTALAAAAVLLLASLTSCGSTAPVTRSAAGGAPQVGPVTIGFSPPNQSAQLLIHLGEGLQAYAASKGAKVIVADPNNDPTTQVQQLTTWIQLGQVQAIWAIALNASALRPVFDKARAKGVAVLATGHPSDYGQSAPGTGVSYSFIDYRAYGRSVGEQLGKCANERLDGRAQAVFMKNSPGQVGLAEYEAGIREGLAATSPGSKIAATLDNRNDRLKSQQGALSAIQANAGINAVAGSNDEGSLGALGALTQAGKDPTRTCVIGAGGNRESLAGVQSGTLYAVAALQFEADLAQNVDQMLKMVADPKAVGIQLTTPIKTVTK